ncbi:MAG: ParB/RepB/Spo0J family partition protein [Labilithrix sp.]
MAAAPQRRALGRGLDALLPTRSTPVSSSSSKNQDGSVFSCPIERIVPQRGQPRQHFAKEKVEELAASIKAHGLIEPIVVRRVPGQERYEIIAGERRWRASQKAGLKEMLVVVKDVSPKDAFELAIIENLQREDLNPVELAEAFDRMTKEHGLTQEALAARLGKDRATIANTLRLLKLPPSVRSRVISGELSEGHARALLGADPGKIEDLAQQVVRGRLNVRAAEALVRSQKKGRGAAAKPAMKTSAVRDLETRMTRAAGTKVVLRGTNADGSKGEVTIPYENLDHLDRILSRVFKLT